jgi:hypothetical protein
MFPKAFFPGEFFPGVFWPPPTGGTPPVVSDLFVVLIQGDEED